MRFPLRAVVMVLAVSPACWAQSIEKAVLDRVKDSTVFIKVTIPKVGEASGSGFVMSSSGNSALIMTNRHVVVPEDDEIPQGVQPTITVVFRSGTPQQQEVAATLLDFDPREIRDLAILEVRGVQNMPKPIAADVTSSEDEFFETMPVYALGFPRGREIGAVAGNMNSNPAITVTSMTISSFRRDTRNRLARVQLNGSAIEGNSGGPLVDAKGRLVGVIVARLRGEAVGFAIPPSVVAQFLKGDIGQEIGELVSVAGGSITVKFTAKIVDPLRKIQSVGLHMGPLIGAFIPSGADPNGSWPPIGNAVHSPMTQQGKTYVGQVSIAANSPASRRVLVQFTLTGPGLNFNTQALQIDLPDKTGSIADLGGKKTRRGGPATIPRWSCEVNTGDDVVIKSHVGGATIELPAGKAMVCAPQYKLFTAPAALAQVDGDFLTAVMVTNDFDPGGAAINAPGANRKFPFTFQGAGLLIWQDSKNFVRLERTKGSVEKGVSLIHRVLFEVYKDGKLVALHYSKPIPEKPIVLAAMRKGSAMRMLFGEPGKGLVVFQELALDFKPAVLVGLSASNLSKQPLKARFEEFELHDPTGKEIDPPKLNMTSLVGGANPRPTTAVPPKVASTSLVFEGASLKVLATSGGIAQPQDDMTKYRGKWTDDRQLRWSGTAKGDTLSVELPVEVAGTYDVTITGTLAADHARVRISLDDKPLYDNKYIDYFYDETRPAKPISLGQLTLEKGDHRLTISVYGKNPKSLGYGVGIDEIKFIPAKK